MDPASQAWFQAMRQRYYPPALNRIPAHLSLFHALPGDASVRYPLREAAASVQPFAMRVEGLRSMGRGVLYALASPELMRLHGALAAQFKTYLTPQDKQPLRPHVVVQNKVEPAEAKALLAELQASFAERRVMAEGLDWWEYMGGPWRPIESFGFGPSPAAAVRVVRLGELTAEAWALLGEYYESVGVVQQDGPETMRDLLRSEKACLWVAYVEGEAAGCVLLKDGIPDPASAECKRLYVRPRFRGRGVAGALMQALETHAREHGKEWVYLDTNDAFRASVALYRGRGYEPCDRYNDNPQASLFFRKRML